MPEPPPNSKFVPGDRGAKDEQDAGKHAAILNPLTAPVGAKWRRQKQILYLIPLFVGQD